MPGFERVAAALGASERAGDAARASLADFVLEGLCSLKKISRTDDGRLHGTPARPRQETTRTVESLMEDDDEPAARGKKKYYN